MITALCVILVCLCALPAFAVDYMLGAKAGFYVWEPFYKDRGGLGSGMGDIDFGTGMLAGPVFSALFTQDLSLSLAGMAGRQSTHWLSVYSDFDAADEVSGCYYFDALRVDMDAALSYRVSESFKVFLGYKYLYLAVDYRSSEQRSPVGGGAPTSSTLNIMKILTPFHGPAAGIGYSLLLSDKVFAAANVSAMYMIGSFNIKKSVTYDQLTPGVEKSKSPSSGMDQIGFNVEPSIGFNPGDGLPIITLGLRYQLLRVRFTEDSDYAEKDKWLNDSLYGVFVSAVYTF